MVEPTHLKNMIVKLDDISPGKVENKKHLRPPPSDSFSWSVEPKKKKKTTPYFEVGVYFIHNSSVDCDFAGWLDFQGMNSVNYRQYIPSGWMEIVISSHFSMF